MATKKAPFGGKYENGNLVVNAKFITEDKPKAIDRYRKKQTGSKASKISKKVSDSSEKAYLKAHKVNTDIAYKKQDESDIKKGVNNKAPYREFKNTTVKFAVKNKILKRKGQ